MNCAHCGEPTEDERMFHRECLTRMVVGSVGHQKGRCTCFAGVEDHSEDGMTRREAALAAWRYFHGVRSELKML